MSEKMESVEDEITVDSLNSDQRNALDLAMNMVGYDITQLEAWRDAELEYGDDDGKVEQLNELLKELGGSHDVAEMKRIAKSVAALL